MKRPHFLTFILVFSSFSSLGSSAASPVVGVYGPVPGLEPSPFYSFRVRKAQDGLNHANSQWKEPFAMLTECTREKNCQNGQNKLGFENLDNWSNTYINFEMMEDNIVEIEITKTWGDPLVKAVVHPVTMALSCELTDKSKAIVGSASLGCSLWMSMDIWMIKMQESCQKEEDIIRVLLFIH